MRELYARPRKLVSNCRRGLAFHLVRMVLELQLFEDLLFLILLGLVPAGDEGGT